MKKIRRWSLLLLIIMLCNCCTVSAVPQTDTCMTLDAKEALAGKNQLLPTAASAILYAPDSDTMVYSWNPDASVDPSGMNKIMTALIALENGNLESVVTVTSIALNSLEIGALTAGLKAGESWTLLDLLYLMMVGSANDAAAVIAEHIAGSQAAFVTRMNERATELGCTNTVFLNPTGLSAEGQYTTARDLAKITAEALKLETFVDVFSTVEYTLPNTDRRFVTTNFMISAAATRDYLDSRVTGGKTGSLSSTDRSLISTAEMDGQRYLSVVMSAKSASDGAGSRNFANFSETKILLDHAFSQYAQRQLLSTNKVMTQFKVNGGENDLAVSARQEVSALMPKDMSIDRVSYQCYILGGSLSAPIAVGDVVGTVQLWYDEMCVAQGDLIAMHAVQEKGKNVTALQPEAEDDSGAMKTLSQVCLLVFLGAAVLVIVIFVGIRFVRMTQRQKQKHPRRRRR